jgi:hypothetical protein
MSERTYFSLRYALPGFTFILMVVLIIWPSLKELVLNNQARFDVGFVSAFLALFTLLEGSALGFLISQPWHLFYDFALRRNALGSAKRFLRDHYNLVGRRRHPHEQEIFHDYMIHLADKQLLEHLQRRWDLLNTVGSTLTAVLVGSLVGFLIRALWLRAEFGSSDVLVIVVLPLLVLVLMLSYRIANREHNRVSLVTVRSVWHSGKFPPHKARAVFPEEYFEPLPKSA